MEKFLRPCDCMLCTRLSLLCKKKTSAGAMRFLYFAVLEKNKTSYIFFRLYRFLTLFNKQPQYQLKKWYQWVFILQSAEISVIQKKIIWEQNEHRTAHRVGHFTWSGYKEELSSEWQNKSKNVIFFFWFHWLTPNIPQIYVLLGIILIYKQKLRTRTVLWVS